MKNNEIIPDLKDRKFNGNLSKIKRIRTEPRQRMRQLLRSSISLELPGRRPGQQPQIV